MKVKSRAKTPNLPLEKARSAFNIKSPRAVAPGLFCLRLAAFSLRLLRGGVRFLHRLAARELDAATVVHAQALHEHLVADLADGLDVRDALVAELGDVA